MLEPCPFNSSIHFENLIVPRLVGFSSRVCSSQPRVISILGSYRSIPENGKYERKSFPLHIQAVHSLERHPGGIALVYEWIHQCKGSAKTGCRNKGWQFIEGMSGQVGFEDRGRDLGLNYGFQWRQFGTKFTNMHPADFCTPAKL